LSDAVDVYSEWIDACEAAQREEEQNASHYDYDGDRSRRHNDGYSDGDEADDTQWRRQGHASSSRHLGGVDEDDEDDDDSLFG
jgi:transcription elongation factor Elf1